MSNRIYICIDLKSFYASVECVERGLDPLKTNLVVADSSRTEKTICLAVSPSLKKYGIPGRARLFEVVQKVREVNGKRKLNNFKRKFSGKSINQDELDNDKTLELDYIAAPPQMKKYMEYSTKIYKTYLKYIAPEDIYVYSIDEVFADITNYIKLYKLSPRDLVTKMIKDVYDTTGITATAGIGTNMFLAKVAMDVVAKKCEPNDFGVRIAGLDEMAFRKHIWPHKPITDIWRVGKGYKDKLEKYKMYTMGDVARKSIEDEELLYKIFGVNAEILIDHAWGWEPTEIKDIKAYKPKINSISSGQVLHCAYNYTKTKLIVKEMVDGLVLDLVKKNLVTDQIVLDIGYDISSTSYYTGEIIEDRYGRKVPKNAHGTINIDHKTSSTKIITEKVLELYERIIDPDLMVRRLNLTACNVVNRNKASTEVHYQQFDLFSSFEEQEQKKKHDTIDEQEENKLQKTLLDIKEKYGKNAILKGMNLEEGGTAIERNGQVGGHRG